MKFKSLLATIVVSLFFLGTGYSQAQDIAGDWKVVLDNDDEAGSHKGKDIGTVEIKKAADGSYYFVGKKVRNNFTTKCSTCPGAKKDKNVVGETWLSGFKKEGSEYTGGSATDPSSGKESSGLRMLIVGPNNLNLIAKKSNGQIRVIKLTRE